MKRLTFPLARPIPDPPITTVFKQEPHESLTTRATHLYKCYDIRGWPPKTRPSHMCYHAEFGRSALKSVGRKS